MASYPRVKMYHPDAGTMECHPSAVAIHERRGWVRVDGIERVELAGADGSPLTTGTVFPPETFDDEPEADVDGADPGDNPTNTTARAKRATTKE